MGYPCEIFVSPIPQEYLCKQCQMVVENPVECSKCSNVFCFTCFQYNSTTSKCYSCQTEEPPKDVDIKIRKVIETLIIKCERCYEQFHLKDYKQHFKICQFESSFMEEEELAQANTHQTPLSVQHLSDQLELSQQPIVDSFSQKIQEIQQELQQISTQNQSELFRKMESLVWQSDIDNKNQLGFISKDLNSLKDKISNINQSDEQNQVLIAQINNDINKLTENFYILEQSVQTSTSHYTQILKLLEQQGPQSKSIKKEKSKKEDNENSEFKSSITSSIFQERIRVLEENQSKLDQTIQKLQKESQEQKKIIQMQNNQLNKQQEFQISGDQQNIDLEKIRENYDNKIQSLQNMVQFIFEKQRGNVIQQAYKAQKQQAIPSIVLTYNPLTSYKSLKFDSQKRACQFQNDIAYKTAILQNRLEQNKAYSIKFKLCQGEHLIIGVSKSIQNYDKSFTCFQTGWGFRNYQQDLRYNNQSVKSASKSNSQEKNPKYGQKLLPGQEIEMIVNTKHQNISYIINGTDYGLAFVNLGSTFNDGELYIAISGSDGCVLIAKSIQEISY